MSQPHKAGGGKYIATLRGGVLPFGWSEDPISTASVRREAELRGIPLTAITDKRRRYVSLSGLCVVETIAPELDGHDWHHVSLSYADRLPSYADMQMVKRVFMGGAVEAYQVFPPASRHVNIHPYCLHLWARRDGTAALPDFTQGEGAI